MQKKTPVRRCCECSQQFDPNPRVGDRQVSCGAERCQRARHADRCRAWRAANAEVGRSHYADVVKPFRERQPDYQRRWRLACRLREIREQSQPLGGALLSSLGALLERAVGLTTSGAGRLQSGVLAGELLGRAVAALRSTISALEQLEASVASLPSLRQ